LVVYRELEFPILGEKVSGIPIPETDVFNSSETHPKDIGANGAKIDNFLSILVIVVVVVIEKIDHEYDYDHDNDFLPAKSGKRYGCVSFQLVVYRELEFTILGEKVSGIPIPDTDVFNSSETHPKDIHSLGIQVVDRA